LYNHAAGRGAGRPDSGVDVRLKRIVISITLLLLLLAFVPVIFITTSEWIRNRELNARVAGALTAIMPGMTVEEADGAFTMLNIPHSRVEFNIVGMIRRRRGIEIMRRDVQIIASYDNSGRVTKVHTEDVVTIP
jgi:hypothetical protein